MSDDMLRQIQTLREARDNWHQAYVSACRDRDGLAARLSAVEAAMAQAALTLTRSLVPPGEDAP